MSVCVSILLNLVVFFHCVQSQATLHTCCQFKENGKSDRNSECFNLIDTQFITTNKTEEVNSRLPKYIQLEEKIVNNNKPSPDLQFRLLPKPPMCSKGNFTIIIPLPVLNRGEDFTTFNLGAETVYVGDIPVSLYPNGYLKYGSEGFSPNEFCIQRITSDKLILLVCNATCDLMNPCVTKCCDIGQVWDLIEYPDGPVRCKSAGDTLWDPVLYSDPYTKVNDPAVTPHFFLIHPRTFCTANEPVIASWKQLFEDKRKPFKILQDGKPKYKYDRRRWDKFSDGLYCTDGAMNFPDEIDEHHKGFFTGYENDSIVFDCGPELKEPQTVKTSELYGICMIFASCFLLVTVIVYILLWEKQNVHGWTLLCYFSSLFFMYLSFSGVHFSSILMEQGEFGGNLTCHTIAVMAHLFFLSSFCWMSTTNFDLWWTFRALKPTDNRSKGIKRFLLYATFSVGVPLTIVGVALSLDFLYGNDYDSWVIVPDYGKKRCYLDRTYALLPYVYGPIGFLLTCNLFFFTVTIYAMYKIQQSTKFATNSSSKNSRQRQSALLFGKLFLVMGIPWIFEVISWVCSPESGQEPWYWTIFDLVNIFQAVAIFVIFVFKRETLISLEGKYPSFQPVTIKPETAESILERHPRLKFMIIPFTHSSYKKRNFSSRKTQSTVTEGSRSRRSSRSGLEMEDKDKFGVELVENEPRGSSP